MTDTKAVMQQALDALDLSQSLLEKSSHHGTILAAYTALRAAIAQPVQTVQTVQTVQQNQQLRDQNTALDARCADLEKAAQAADPEDLMIAYMAGLADGKKAAQPKAQP